MAYLQKGLAALGKAWLRLVHRMKEVRTFFYYKCIMVIFSFSYSRRVYGQLCIKTLHERHNGIERLVVCLSEYLPLHCVYRISSMSMIAV